MAEKCVDPAFRALYLDATMRILDHAKARVLARGVPGSDEPEEPEERAPLIIVPGPMGG